MYRIALAAALILGLSACGAGAPRIYTDSEFRSPLHRVAILPFALCDDSSSSQDQVMTDELAESLMERGIIVVDAAGLMHEAIKEGIPTESINDSLVHLCSSIGVDGAFVGRSRYRFEGPSTESVTTDDVQVFTDVIVTLFQILAGTDDDGTSTSRETIDGSYSSAGGYRLQNAGTVFIDALRRDTVLSSSADRNSVLTMFSRIADKVAK